MIVQLKTYFSHSCSTQTSRLLTNFKTCDMRFIIQVTSTQHTASTKLQHTYCILLERNIHKNEKNTIRGGTLRCSKQLYSTELQDKNS